MFQSMLLVQEKVTKKNTKNLGLPDSTPPYLGLNVTNGFDRFPYVLYGQPLINSLV